MALHKAISYTLLLLLVIKYSHEGPITIEAEVEPPKKEDYRLGATIIPSEYKIDLTVLKIAKDETFSGVVEITITGKKDFTKLVLNAGAGMTVSTASLKEAPSGSKELLKDKKHAVDETLQRVTFELEAEEKVGQGKKYLLRIKFDGKLQNNMQGFYLSSYELQNGDTEWLATTQFEPTHARKAFPCFDEPAFKATFEISISAPLGYQALSNGKTLAIKENPKDKLVTTQFEKTPKMSTYLVAFIISKFDGLTKFSNHLLSENRVWSRLELLTHAKYAATFAANVIDKLNEHTDIDYNDLGLAKLDQVAIPDFAAGAMENWGLVTYRESSLIWDEEESSVKVKEQVATVIAHELAHTWFGNYLTCEWWDVTWLNEGFARYFEYFATHMVETGWELNKQFILEQKRSVFERDALKTSEPLTSGENEILTPDQISSKFSSITYNKGASILYMLKSFLGEGVFDEAITYYLRSRGNTDGVVRPEHLWESFPSAPGIPEEDQLKTIMNAWTTKPGYPVIDVTVNKDKKVQLKQQRFFWHGIDPEDKTSWSIPIKYITSKQPEANWYWLKGTDTTTLTGVEIQNEDSWVLLNHEDSGYYRVNYKDLWRPLKTALETEDGKKKISDINRAQLVDDAMSLARAGLLDYSIALEVASYLKSETSYYPWYAGFKVFSYLKQRLQPGSDAAVLLKMTVREWMTKLYEEVTKPAESLTHIEIQRKSLALMWACELGVQDCIDKAKESFQNFRDGTRIAADEKNVVYCYGLRDSENPEEDWDFLYERLKNTQLPSEISTIITALGCTKDEFLLEKYLKLSVDPGSGIRKQDANSVYNAVITGNPEGVTVAFDFLENNFKEIKENYGGLNALSSVISVTADRLTSEDEIKAFKKFIDDNKEDLEEAADVGKQAAEKANDNLQWVQKYEDKLEGLLEGHAPETTTTTSSPSSSKTDTTTPDSTTVSTPPSTTPSGATSTSVCSTIIILGILKTVIRI